MSVLVLGAGTDYALLLVARYREELHRTADKHEAMRTALASAGPAIFASAATVIAALLCLMIAKVNGTAGLGPIAAIGHRLRRALQPHPAAGAADDLRPPRLLALRPAHARDRARRRARSPSAPGGGSSRAPALAALAAGLPRLPSGPGPAAAGPAQLGPAGDQRPPDPLADRRPARPGRLHARTRCAATSASTPATPPTASGAGSATASRSRRGGSSLGSIAVLLILCAGLRLLLDRPDQRRQLPHRSRVGRRPAPARQELPLGTTGADRRHRPEARRSPRGAQGGRRRRRRRGGLRRRSPRARPASWSRRSSNPTPTRPRPSTWSNRSAKPPTGSRPAP